MWNFLDGFQLLITQESTLCHFHCAAASIQMHKNFKELGIFSWPWSSRQNQFSPSAPLEYLSVPAGLQISAELCMVNTESPSSSHGNTQRVTHRVSAALTGGRQGAEWSRTYLVCTGMQAPLQSSPCSPSWRRYLRPLRRSRLRFAPALPPAPRSPPRVSLPWALRAPSPLEAHGSFSPGQIQVLCPLKVPPPPSAGAQTEADFSLEAPWQIQCMWHGSSWIHMAFLGAAGMQMHLTQGYGTPHWATGWFTTSFPQITHW